MGQNTLKSPQNRRSGSSRQRRTPGWRAFAAAASSSPAGHLTAHECRPGAGGHHTARRPVRGTGGPRGESRELFLVGGAALAVAYDATRATRDGCGLPSRRMRQACPQHRHRRGDQHQTRPVIPGRSPPLRGLLAGRPVALASSGEALELPCVHAGQPILAVRGRWADPRVAGNMGVTQGVHVRPILVDPCVYLISSADGPVAGDEDIDVFARHALEAAAARRGSPRSGQRCRSESSIGIRDIRKHVSGDENPAFLNQQRRMARGMRLMLDNPDLRAIPRNLRHLGGQAGNEAEQVQRYLLGDVRRYQLGDAGLPTRVR